jgi:hypothetical protein
MRHFGHHDQLNHLMGAAQLNKKNKASGLR